MISYQYNRDFLLKKVIVTILKTDGLYQNQTLCKRQKNLFKVNPQDKRSLKEFMSSTIVLKTQTIIPGFKLFKFILTKWQRECSQFNESIIQAVAELTCFKVSTELT